MPWIPLFITFPPLEQSHCRRNPCYGEEQPLALLRLPASPAAFFQCLWGESIQVSWVECDLWWYLAPWGQATGFFLFLCLFFTVVKFSSLFVLHVLIWIVFYWCRGFWSMASFQGRRSRSSPMTTLSSMSSTAWLSPSSFPGINYCPFSFSLSYSQLPASCFQLQELSHDSC